MSDELPQGWARAPLRNAVELLQNGPFGSLLHRSDYVSGGTPLINPANIVAGKLVPDEDISVGPDVLERLASYVMRPGDVVVGRRGEMGRAALVSDERKQWFCGTGCAFVRPGEALASKFLAMWFGSPAVRATLETESVGATMSNLSTRILGNLELLVPPLPEQRRIVFKVEALLARVNAARERLEKVPVLLKRFRQAVLAKAFRGELVPTEAELAACEGRSYQSAAELLGQAADAVSDELPEGWASAVLGDLIDGFQAGRNLTAQGRAANDGEFGVLKISAVTWGEFRPDENKALLDGDTPRAHEVVRRGDLLITRANTSELVGSVVIVERDFPKLMLPDKILRLLAKTKVVEPRYLLHALRSQAAREHFSVNATGTSESMRNLSQPKLASTPVRLPPLPEQRRIVARIEALLALTSKVEAETERQLRMLDRAPHTILQKAFSGELVPTEAELARAEGRVYESAGELLARLTAARAEDEPTAKRSGRRARPGGTRAAGLAQQPSRAARSI